MTSLAVGVLIAVSLTVILIFGEMWRELHTFKVTRYTVRSARLADTGKALRILFLSDLHGREYGRENIRLYQAVREERPDLILIGGDMLVGKDGVPYETALRFIQKLPSLCPVYYANGNHEQRMKEEPEMYSQSYAAYRDALKQSGVHFLENERRIVSIGNISLEICALELPLHTYRKLKKSSVSAEDVASLIGSGGSNSEKKGESYCRILLAHNPSYMEAYLDWGADLVLSGHLHGGIIRIPGIGGLISPQLSLFPKYSGELTEEGDETVIVSRGLGTHTIHLRLFNTPELVSILLKGNDRKKTL